MKQTALNYFIAGKRRLLNVSFLLLLLSQRNSVIMHVPHSCRRLSRNTCWWGNVWNTFSDARFKKTFPITRTTFTFILNRIRHVIMRQTVTEQACALLYRLGVGNLLYYHGNGGNRSFNCLFHRTRSISAWSVFDVFEH